MDADKGQGEKARRELRKNATSYIKQIQEATSPQKTEIRPKAISFPHTDLKPIISKFLLKKWQQRWYMIINNKFFQIQLT